MKIFLYGSNCASVINSLAIGLGENGAKVKGFSFYESSYVNYSELKLLTVYTGKNPLTALLYRINNYSKLIKAIIWSDVVHIFWDANPFIIQFCRLLKKKRFVTFVGSEIRRPSISKSYNPYYDFAYLNKDYEYKVLENDNSSLQRQRKFSSAGFSFVVWEVLPYLDRSICKNIYVVPHASLNSISIKSRENKKEIRIVHAPSAPVAKGSQYIIAALERLQQNYSQVQYSVIKNVSNEEYQKIIADCDIYVDQVIWGGYGIAAHQAMMMGKVVVCYINPHLQKTVYPDRMPIQNATIDSLDVVLEKLVHDKKYRDRVSAESISYYKEMHEPKAVGKKMLIVYKKN